MNVWVIGNWKMHGTCAEAAQRLQAVKLKLAEKAPKASTRCVVCPPFVHLSLAHDAIQSSVLALGAQDVAAVDDGAYTGQISAHMLSDLNCQFTLVGHSERRQFCAETDEIVLKKFLRAQNAHIIPVLCLGETLAEKESGQTESILSRQLSLFLSAGVDWSSALLAYEPVWAIGTGKTPTLDEIEGVHAFLRRQVASVARDAAAVLPILYGGSVKPSNVAELVACPNVNGVLVGGASLDAEAFATICSTV